MKNSKRLFWGGIAAIIAGITGATLTIIDQYQDQFLVWLAIISMITSLIALTGIYYFLKKLNEKQVQLGYILAVAGSILVNMDVIIELTGMIYVVGMVILALVSFKDDRIPKWVPSMWIASPVVGFSGVLLGEVLILFFLGSIAFGLGYIGYGYVIIKERI